MSSPTAVVERNLDVHSSHCCWLGFSSLMSIPCSFPFDPFEIEYKDRVKDRNQEQGYEGSDGASADVGVAKRFPEGATFECEWEQSQDRCANGDHHGANAFDPGIRKSELQRLPFFVHLFNKVEEHDHMANNDTDQTYYAEKGHEAERCVHDFQRNQRTDGTIRRCGKDEKWLDGIVELDEKGELDAYERDREYNTQIEEAINLLRLFASDFELVSGRQVLLESIQLRLCRSKDFGCE